MIEGRRGGRSRAAGRTRLQDVNKNSVYDCDAYQFRALSSKQTKTMSANDQCLRTLHIQAARTCNVLPRPILTDNVSRRCIYLN